MNERAKALSASAEKHVRLAALYSKAHDLLSHWCYMRFGKRGPWISCIGQDHWPNKFRPVFRRLCDLIIEHTDASRKDWRKARRRLDTWRSMRLATRAKYNAGFYG